MGQRVPYASGHLFEVVTQPYSSTGPNTKKAKQNKQNKQSKQNKTKQNKANKTKQTKQNKQSKSRCFKLLIFHYYNIKYNKIIYL